MDNYGSEKWVFHLNPMENQIPMTLPAWDFTHPADGKKFGTAWHARTHSSIIPSNAVLKHQQCCLIF